MKGKQHLLDLYAEKYPVIPTIGCLDDIAMIRNTACYILKPKDGYSAYGLKVCSEDQLRQTFIDGSIIQPKMRFSSEICFYFIDERLQYALEFMPNRWPDYPAPREFAPDREQMEFARRFIDWNHLTAGIQRIDAIKLADNSLLLLEIEDASPYLNLENISARTRDRFLENLRASISRYLQ